MRDLKAAILETLAREGVSNGATYHHGDLGTHCAVTLTDTATGKELGYGEGEHTLREGADLWCWWHALAEALVECCDADEAEAESDREREEDATQYHIEHPCRCDGDTCYC